LLAAGPVWNGGNSGRFGVDWQSRLVVAAGPMWDGSGSCRAVGIRTGYRRRKPSQRAVA